MTKHKDRASTPTLLQMIGNGTSEPFVGVHEVPGRLPAMLRYPGESEEAFSRRALHQLDGEGACWARLMYASESWRCTSRSGSKFSGSSGESGHTGYSHPEETLVNGHATGKRYR